MLVIYHEKSKTNLVNNDNFDRFKKKSFIPSFVNFLHLICFVKDTFFFFFNKINK